MPNASPSGTSWPRSTRRTTPTRPRPPARSRWSSSNGPDLTDSPIGWVARHIRRYVASGGRSGHQFNGRPALLITTRGRHTGTLRRTALYYTRDGDRYIVVASGGGEPTHPSWYLNLLTDPLVVLQVGPATFPARARTANPTERPPLWARMAALFPKYDSYQAKTTREIPIVILDPIPPTPIKVGEQDPDT